MNNESTRLKAKLASLNLSLDELESELNPLLAQSLPEAIIGLDPMQQAKLQVVLPYLVYDLIFIYLKTKGTDPKSHPVVSELERVRHYFEKITDAENPPARSTQLDKAAAERFIKNAIAQAAAKVTAPQSSTPLQPPSIPIRTTSKMTARAQYEAVMQKKRQEQSESEDEVEVYEESDSTLDPNTKNRIAPEIQADRLAGSDPPVTTSHKRQRPPVDPFAGYEESTFTAKQLTKKPRH